MSRSYFSLTSFCPPTRHSYLSLTLHVQVNEPDKVSATLAKMAASSDPGIQVWEGGKGGGALVNERVSCVMQEDMCVESIRA